MFVPPGFAMLSWKEDGKWEEFIVLDFPEEPDSEDSHFGTNSHVVFWRVR